MRCDGFASRNDGHSLTPYDYMEMNLKVLGMRCEPGEGGLSGSELRTWSVGEIGVLDSYIRGCTVTPACERRDAYPEEVLILKIFNCGSVTFEQVGRISHIDPGSVILVDPTHDFKETFSDGSRISTFKLPKRLLRNRGLPFSLNGVIEGDMARPEILMVRDILLKIISHSAHVSPAYAECVQQQILDLAGMILAGADAKAIDSGRHATLYRARGYIRRNFANPDLDSSMIGNALHLSVNYLNRLFREEGISLMRYVWQVRLENAAQELRTNSGRRVDQVAYACGFSSAAHFSRAFRARYGHAPSQLRACEA